MPKAVKSPCDPCASERGKLKKRVCFFLEDDVIEGGNAVMDRITFKNLSHAANVFMRRAIAQLNPVRPDGSPITMQIDPFEQVIYAKRLIINKAARGKGRRK